MDEKKDLQWICTRLCHGSGYSSSAEFTQRTGILFAFGGKVCSDRVVDHEIESNLILINVKCQWI